MEGLISPGVSNSIVDGANPQISRLEIIFHVRNRIFIAMELHIVSVQQKRLERPAR